MGYGAEVVGPVLLAALLLAGVLLYNRLVRLRIRADHAWAQVDAQLQRRHDLVPGLVSTVAAYTSHERGVLDEVTAARVAALSVDEPTGRADREDELSAALSRLIAVAESHPQLRADDNFRALAGELAATEDRIAFARGFANSRVASYREAITSFPGVLLARPFRFDDRPMFDADPEGRAARTIEPEELR